MLEAYKVGITVALTNKVSQGLMLIGRDLTRTDAQAKKLHATLKEIKLLGVGGALIGGAGLAGLHALGKTLDAAKEYRQALGQFKAIGLGDAMNKDADKFARGSSVIGASATDLIRTVRDLHTVLGDYGMAKALAPQLSQMKFANQAVFGAHGMDFSHSQLQAMEKIIEMKGGFKSPAEFLKQADMMQKVISGTGGMVKPSDFLQFIKTAGVSGRLLDSETFYYTMEPLIQEMTGGRVGTGLMSAYNNLAQGRSTNRAAAEMQRIGIIAPGGVEYTKIGTVKRILPGSLKGMDQFAANPYGWLKDVLLPAMAKRGITSEKDVLNEMGVLFGNRTGSSLFSLMFLQREKIEKNMGISRGAMGTRDLYKLALTTPDGAERALGAAWQDLKIATGQSLLPVIVPGINKLAELLRDLGRWINAHPIAFDYLIKGFAGLSAALLFSGSVLTLKAAFLAFSLIMPNLAGMITGSVVPALGLLSAALLPLAAIAYHKQIANAIDNSAPGIGDTLLAGKDWLNNTFRLDGSPRSVVPPARGGNTTINTAIHLDGRQIATAVTRHQVAGGSAPPSGPSGFDGRSLPQWSGATGAY